MKDILTIFVNTHSSASDCWNMFFGQLEKHWPDHPRVVVALDEVNCPWSHRCGHERFMLPYPCPNDWESVDYSPAKKFSSQYLMGLCAVETPYVLPLQEDFLLYADVDDAAIIEAIESVAGNYYSAVRLIDSGPELEYSMQASIWKTRALMSVYANTEASTPWEAEVAADDVMLNCGVLCKKRDDSHLPMRGRNHRDSPVFPYCSTAIVRGRWNHEYRTELTALHKEYGIDASQRGWTE